MKLIKRMLYPLLRWAAAVYDKWQQPAASEMSWHKERYVEQTDTAAQLQTEQQKTYAQNILRFLNIEVKDIMTTRNDIIAFDVSMPFSEVFQRASLCGFSRIPVYERDYDHVIGVLYVKHLLQYKDKDDSFDWRSILLPPLFVPEYKDAHRLLKDFQTAKKHLAIVIDEYGGLVGLITMEDILEEIVGEIVDEFDTSERPLFTPLEGGGYCFEAKISINDFCKVMQMPDASLFEEMRGEADSLGGLLMELCGEIPAPGTVIDVGLFQCSVEKADNRHIEQIKVTLRKEHENEP